MKNLIIKLVVLTGFSALTVKIGMAIVALLLVLAVAFLVFKIISRDKRAKIIVNHENNTFTHKGEDKEIAIISDEHFAFLDERFNITNKDTEKEEA